MLVREGERLQAGAHARVRESATMTATELETGLGFGITPRKWLPSSIHCSAKGRSPRLSRSRGHRQVPGLLSFVLPYSHRDLLTI
jgi:hypothetical protein